MQVFKPYLDSIKDEKHQLIMKDLLQWVIDTYPMLGKKIAWNQPHFTHNGTFIIAFTHAKQHISVVPEFKVIEVFKDIIKSYNFAHTHFIFKIKWTEDIPYDLIKKMIEYNMKDKLGMTTYWRTSKNA